MEYFANPPTRPILKQRDVDYLQPSPSRLMGYLNNTTDKCLRLEIKEFAMNFLLYVALLKGGDYHWRSVELSIHELMDDVDYEKLPQKAKKARRNQIIDMIINGPNKEDMPQNLLTPP
ncbi:hypothetical protein FRC19_005383 [Serendipita sp. 401]|nr:hypothetical protein FRC15_005641 [Serendipita sp. 397]KAG8773339.1 hypothetical protein FRC16_005417 [Serendipita sp. 398]KAG8806901.1 hypothetical protein FRC18_005846 [Serendipita sp. 400]KAG8809194.1 hypothetical protein FRC19_005383 [Serendipita sp. 401]KAG8840300.1 hypothetical protein FRC20_005652 [Serendipita sp. 405]KAG9029275.1 hypothetical protein FS842_004600 [Serendipita sp. 407]